MNLIQRHHRTVVVEVVLAVVVVVVVVVVSLTAAAPYRRIHFQFKFNLIMDLQEIHLHVVILPFLLMHLRILLHYHPRMKCILLVQHTHTTLSFVLGL